LLLLLLLIFVPLFGFLEFLVFIRDVDSAASEAHLMPLTKKGICSLSPDGMPLSSELTEPNHSKDKGWELVLNNIILPQREKASWNLYYKSTCAFIDKNTRSLRKTRSLRIIEVGTAYGGNANSLASCFPNAIIVAVDPLLPGYDEGDAHSTSLSQWAKDNGMNAENFALAWGFGLLYDQRLKYGCRYHLLKGYSIDVANDLLARADIEKFDVAFIDGLHTYDGAKNDIRAYMRLMNPGGIMLFNDYMHPAFPGVTKAVDEFVKDMKAHIIIGDENNPPGEGNAAVFV